MISNSVIRFFINYISIVHLFDVVIFAIISMILVKMEMLFKKVGMTYISEQMEY
jgi:hypothetical protein